MARSPLFEEIAAKPIGAKTAALPPKVVAAAQKRGRALDWWKTAQRLLDELRALGWASDSHPQPSQEFQREKPEENT